MHAAPEHKAESLSVLDAVLQRDTVALEHVAPKHKADSLIVLKTVRQNQRADHVAAEVSFEHAAPQHKAAIALGLPLEAMGQTGCAGVHTCCEFVLGVGMRAVLEHAAPLQEADCETMLEALKHIELKRTSLSRRK